MEKEVGSVQQAIDIAVREGINVVIRCALTDDEIKSAIKDARGCNIFRGLDQAPVLAIRQTIPTVQIVPPEWKDYLGGAGPELRFRGNMVDQ